MGLDPSLTAAATLHRRRLAGADCTLDDAVYQVSLAHVLLDGGYDGVTTLDEALQGGDHGLGTVDRLDGELVVVDGVPWRVDWHGHAEVMPGETLTPFTVVTTMERPQRQRVRDLDRASVADLIEGMVDDPDGVVAVRIEGRFEWVLVRSVPPQDPPYRPYVEVCQTEEVRWEHRPFEGVFVGFRFPGLEGGVAIPGLHLHGLDHARTTGGHNHDLVIADAELTVDVSHDVVLSLPDRSMIDLLETQPEIREAQRVLLRRGASTTDQIAADLGVDAAAAAERLQWLADRGFAELRAEAGGPDRWHSTLRSRARQLSPRMRDVLDSL